VGDQRLRTASDTLGQFKTYHLPKHREFLSEAERLTPKHPIQALAEFDVTEARKLLQEYKERRGKTISFTAWLIKCIAQAVSEDKKVQAYKKGKRLFVFEDVDVAFVMDMPTESRELVANAIVRRANEKFLVTISSRYYHELPTAKQLDGGCLHVCRTAVSGRTHTKRKKQLSVSQIPNVGSRKNENRTSRCKPHLAGRQVMCGAFPGC
jgi:hypothetical protein